MKKIKKLLNNDPASKKNPRNNFSQNTPPRNSREF